jgi:hypothetical protein
VTRPEHDLILDRGRVAGVSSTLEALVIPPCEQRDYTLTGAGCKSAPLSPILGTSAYFQIRTNTSSPDSTCNRLALTSRSYSRWHGFSWNDSDISDRLYCRSVVAPQEPVYIRQPQAGPARPRTPFRVPPPSRPDIVPSKRSRFGDLGHRSPKYLPVRYPKYEQVRISISPFLAHIRPASQLAPVKR